MALTCALVGAVAAMSNVGAAAAPTCTDTWTGAAGDGLWSDPGNWDHGAPTATSAVCIEAAGHVVLQQESLSVTMLDLGSQLASGTATLEIDAGAAVDVGDVAIGVHGALLLDGTDRGAPVGNAILASSGTVTNAGAITLGGEGEGATLSGNVLSTGTVAVTRGTVILGGTGRGEVFDNRGSFTIEEGVSGAPTALDTVGITFFNDAGGEIFDAGGMHIARYRGRAGTFEQGDGSAAGAPIQVEGEAIKFTGTGRSSIDVDDNVDLSGNLVAGQSLQLRTGATATATGSFTNAGTITLNSLHFGSRDGVERARLMVRSGTLTNSGAIVAEGEGEPGLLSGRVVNDGTLYVTSGGLDHDGTFVNEPSGSLSLSFSASSVSYLHVKGNFTAGGTLLPMPASGFVPSPGEEFSLIAVSAGTYTGRFASVAGGFEADYTSFGFIGVSYPRALHYLVQSLSGRGEELRARLSCTPGSGSCATYAIEGTVLESGRGGRHPVVIASASGLLAAGRSKSLVLPLNDAGRALLERRPKLEVEVTVSARGKAIKKARVTLTRARKQLGAGAVRPSLGD